MSTNHLTIREELSDTFSGWLGKFGAIELENKGSVARDHLALGRTLLLYTFVDVAYDINISFLIFSLPWKMIEIANRNSPGIVLRVTERTFLAWLRTSLAFASIGMNNPMKI